MKPIVKDYISNHTEFTTEEFWKYLRSEAPEIARSTVYNILKALRDQGEIVQKKRGFYKVAGKKNYTYTLSDTAKTVSNLIKKSYPLVNFQVWELYQMNEFVNHLMARNTIFIEVENLLDETVFNLLFEKYPHVLLNPGEEEYYKYVGDETIIVRKLISEAPASYGEYNQTSLEKLLVDLFGRGLSGRIISRSEYRAIYEDSFSRYNINQERMFRYARRRGNEKKIKEFICKETNIVLEDPK